MFCDNQWATQLLKDQTVLPEDDRVILWAHKTVEIATLNEIGPTEITVDHTSAAYRHHDGFAEYGVTFLFPITGGSEVSYRIQFQTGEAEPRIWCGPSNFPACDQVVLRYMLWISSHLDRSQLMHQSPPPAQ